MASKDEFLKKMAEEAGISKTQALSCWNAFFKCLSDSLIKRVPVKFTGFGTFCVITRKEKNGRNPKTGKEITIAQTDRIAFRLSDSMKNKLNDPK